MKKNDKRFRDFLSHVDKSLYFEIRRQIIERCQISFSCYYKWRDGASTPNANRKSYINGIAVKFGYDAVYPNSPIVELEPSILVNHA